MKFVILILSFLLSWLNNGSGSSFNEKDICSDDILIEAASQEMPADAEDYNTLCLTSARGMSFSGEDHTSTPTVRSLGSSRRAQSSTSSSSRIIKDGKVVDRQNFNSFLQTFYGRPSGRFCFDRYIYSIRCLLI